MFEPDSLGGEAAQQAAASAPMQTTPYGEGARVMAQIEARRPAGVFEGSLRSVEQMLEGFLASKAVEERASALCEGQIVLVWNQVFLECQVAGAVCEVARHGGALQAELLNNLQELQDGQARLAGRLAALENVLKTCISEQEFLLHGQHEFAKRVDEAKEEAIRLAKAAQEGAEDTWCVTTGFAQDEISDGEPLLALPKDGGSLLLGTGVALAQ